jgi:signal transduction histidine kinase
MSLRSRLVLSYILIIVVCLAIIAVAVTLVLQSYRDRYTMARLEDIVRPVYVQLRTSIATDVSLDRLWFALEEQAADSEVYILLLDGRGNIVRQAVPAPDEDTAELAVLPGELPSRITQAQQGKFTAASGQTYIYAALPTGRLFDSSDSAVIRTIVAAVPRGQPIGLLATLIRPFLYTGLIALAVSIIIAFILARSIFRPLQKVTQAAEDIAHGQYGREIKVTGPREVRGLATAFNEMSLQVKQAQERLRHFIADVSHQLKSPLTSIHGFARAITDGTAADEEAVQKSAGTIQDESRKMMRQVDELLELSRMQSGQVKLASEPVNLVEILEQCREIFLPRAEEKELRITLDAADIPGLTGDADRLEQVFNNLLDNAIKNSPAGGEVLITATGDLSAVEIRIIDSGPGIPPEQIPFVFQRFYQAMGVRTGVGLGLAIAREIVLAHGGDISVTSSPGEKTEFIIRLPV